MLFFTSPQHETWKIAAGAEIETLQEALGLAEGRAESLENASTAAAAEKARGGDEVERALTEAREGTRAVEVQLAKQVSLVLYCVLIDAVSGMRVTGGGLCMLFVFSSFRCVCVFFFLDTRGIS